MPKYTIYYTSEWSDNPIPSDTFDTLEEAKAEMDATVSKAVYSLKQWNTPVHFHNKTATSVTLDEYGTWEIFKHSVPNAPEETEKFDC